MSNLDRFRASQRAWASWACRCCTGEHDEATPESTRAYAALTPDSEVVVIEGAAHVANYDRPTEYMRALRGWLSGHDGT